MVDAFFHVSVTTLRDLDLTDTHLLANMPTTPPKLLPGCTKGKDHKEPWQMSIYHLQTYILMRGGVDKEDPMLKWIAEQDKKKAKKAAEKAGQDGDDKPRKMGGEKG